MRRLVLLATLAYAVPAGASGTVVLVPGSGFHGIGPQKEIRLSIAAQQWRDWGFRTRLVRYREGRAGLRDVRAAISAAGRARPDEPVCVYGESSGGTFALLAAAADNGARCLVIAASPTDQETWALSDRRGAQRLSREVWPGYFGGPSQDDSFEPYDVWSAFRPTVPVMLLYAQGDQAVPAQQGKIFATAPGDVRLRVLHQGARMFVHNRVARDDLLRARGEARTFVGVAMRASHPPAP